MVSRRSSRAFPARLSRSGTFDGQGLRGRFDVRGFLERCPLGLTRLDTKARLLPGIGSCHSVSSRVSSTTSASRKSRRRCCAPFVPSASPHFVSIVDDFYAAIDGRPEARAAISGGAPQIERLKQTLIDWLDSMLLGPHDEAYYELPSTHRARARPHRLAAGVHVHGDEPNSRAPRRRDPAKAGRRSVDSAERRPRHCIRFSISSWPSCSRLTERISS